MKTTYATAILSILSLGAMGAVAASAPVAVSPGSWTGGTVSGTCPTFHWGRLEGVAGYELVIYRVSEDGTEGEPVLSQRITGAALGWTPSLDRCLKPGEAYAWSVRASTAAGLSEWAAPLFFEVAPQPSAEELAAAAHEADGVSLGWVLRRLLGERHETGIPEFLAPADPWPLHDRSRPTR